MTILVGKVGLEPTESFDTDFTDQRATNYGLFTLECAIWESNLFGQKMLDRTCPFGASTQLLY